jgi:hypothetical protein
VPLDTGRFTLAAHQGIQPRNTAFAPIVTVRTLCIIFSTILVRSRWATSIDARVIEVVLTNVAGRTVALE